MPQMWDFGVLVVKNLSVGICDCTPLTAHSSFFFSAPANDNDKPRSNFSSPPQQMIMIYQVNNLFTLANDNDNLSIFSSPPANDNDIYSK